MTDLHRHNSGVGAASVGISVTDNLIILENSKVRRILQKTGNTWRTKIFSRVDCSDELIVESEEFTILLMSGQKLTLNDFQAHGEPVSRQAGDTVILQITYIPRKHAVKGTPSIVSAEYAIAHGLGGGPYLRKNLILEMEDGGAVDRLEVERFKTCLACDLGGIGEPVFMGDKWFTGLEYPGGYTGHCSGWISLAHHPGSAMRENDGMYRIHSKTAVIGTGLADDPVEVAFGDYLESIRQPAPPHIVVNHCGTSLRHPKSEADLLTFFDAYAEGLDPCGVRLDSLQIDLIGWEPKTLSRPRKEIFPKGYKSLSSALKSRGSSLSLWLSLNGTGNLWQAFAPKDSVQWFSDHGIERTNGPFQDFEGHFCVSMPQFTDAMRATLKYTIDDADVSYFKHDFVQITCSAEGHNHLPTVRHGLEANLDALIGFMDWEHEYKPELLCAPTSYVWLSPWWLKHTNYIWYGASDSGALPAWPQRSAPEWEMNYHDGHLYKVYHRWRHQMPVSALNTQAFLRHIKPDKETLHEWTDYAMMVCGRGLRLIDLYLEPDLPGNFWQALGESLRWWRENRDILGATRMVGGNPLWGEVYGYAHWHEEQGIICLRNPDVAEKTIKVPFDKSVAYRGSPAKLFRGRIVYPYVEEIPTQFVSGRPLLFTIPGYSVMLIRLEPGEVSGGKPAETVELIEAGGMAVPVARDGSLQDSYNDDRSLAITANMTISVPDEDMAQCSLCIILRSSGELPSLSEITVNGSAVQVHEVHGAGEIQAKMVFTRGVEGSSWSLHTIDLGPFRGKRISVAAVTSRNPIPFSLQAWIVADRPVVCGREAPSASEGIFPPTFWHSFRRQTIQILSYSLSPTPLHH